MIASTNPIRAEVAIKIFYSILHYGIGRWDPNETRQRKKRGLPKKRQGATRSDKKRQEVTRSV